MAHSETFRDHDKAVKDAQTKKEASACMIFCVSPGETFYYGFDGVDLQKGKHSGRRAETLINREEALVIL
jgi:hypothetical protein